MSEIPIIDMSDENAGKELDFELSTTGSSSDYRNDRERPYNGQSWTDEGERGKTVVEGLTMRDFKDCYVKGFLLACGEMVSVEAGTWRTMDVFKTSEEPDPLAVIQNTLCEVEKMMGIWPNTDISTDDIMAELTDEQGTEGGEG